MDNEQKTIEVTVKYEREIKTYGGCGVETEYYPQMKNGSLIVKKVSVGGIAILSENRGVVDRYGREQVPCIYNSCKPINEKYFIVGLDYTDGGFSGDDYSFPKQKYGIVNSNGKEIVPLVMEYIIFHNNYVSISGFGGEFYIGLIDQSGKLSIHEGLKYTVSDSRESIYNSLIGTNKIAIIGQGFVLRDGDFNNFQEFENAYIKFENAYIKFVNEKNNSTINDMSSSIGTPKKAR